VSMATIRGGGNDNGSKRQWQLLSIASRMDKDRKVVTNL
jgi:hypothetical protein